jgi:hypothetical protein
MLMREVALRTDLSGVGETKAWIAARREPALVRLFFAAPPDDDEERLAAQNHFPRLPFVTCFIPEADFQSTKVMLTQHGVELRLFGTLLPTYWAVGDHRLLKGFWPSILHALVSSAHDDPSAKNEPIRQFLLDASPTTSKAVPRKRERRALELK